MIKQPTKIQNNGIKAKKQNCSNQKTTKTFSNSTVPLILVNYIIDKENTTLHRQLALVGEWLESVGMV